MSTTRTFRDAVAAYFKANPEKWISAYALMQVGGALAFRTRCSECRTQLGMDIQNKVERDENGVAHSYYQYVPKALPEQPDLFTSKEKEKAA